MKKIVKIAGLSLLAVGILGACGNTEPVEKDTTNQTVQDKPIVSKPEIKKEEPKNTLADDVMAYHNMLNPAVTGLTQSLEKFSELNSEASSNPSLMFSDDWKTDMAATLVSMGIYLDQIRKVNPPASMTETHNLILQAVEEYQYVVDNYANALDNLDADAITECITHMQQGNNFVLQATDKLNSMK
jgi:hypothetical protein